MNKSKIDEVEKPLNRKFILIWTDGERIEVQRDFTGINRLELGNMLLAIEEMRNDLLIESRKVGNLYDITEDGEQEEE